jgi:hypothetical protein
LALKQAIADAGLVFKDIDGLIVNRISDYQHFCETAGLSELAIHLGVRWSPRLSPAASITFSVIG